MGPCRILFVLLSVCGLVVSSRKASEFVAAVYEHVFVVAQNTSIVPSRKEALTIMMQNMDIYEVQMKNAAKQVKIGRVYIRKKTLFWSNLPFSRLRTGGLWDFWGYFFARDLRTTKNKDLYFGGFPPISKHREELKIWGESEYFLTTSQMFWNRRKTLRVFEVISQIHQCLARKFTSVLLSTS